MLNIRHHFADNGPSSQSYCVSSSHVWIYESESYSVMSVSLWPHRLYSPWNSPGQNPGVGSRSILQVIVPTQGSNPGPVHCRQILYHLSHKETPRILECVAYPFSRGYFWPKNRTRVSCSAGGFFTSWAMKEVYRYESWTIKKSKCQIIDAFALWYWEESESPLDCKEIKSVNPKGNQSGISFGRTDAEAGAPILWPPDVNWLIGKDPDAGKDWMQKEKGVTEDEMAGWHHWLDGHEFE